MLMYRNILVHLNSNLWLSLCIHTHWLEWIHSELVTLKHIWQDLLKKTLLSTQESPKRKHELIVKHLPHVSDHYFIFVNIMKNEMIYSSSHDTSSQLSTVSITIMSQPKCIISVERERVIILLTKQTIILECRET